MLSELHLELHLLLVSDISSSARLLSCLLLLNIDKLFEMSHVTEFFNRGTFGHELPQKGSRTRINDYHIAGHCVVEQECDSYGAEHSQVEIRGAMGLEDSVLRLRAVSREIV